LLLSSRDGYLGVIPCRESAWTCWASIEVWMSVDAGKEKAQSHSHLAPVSDPPRTPFLESRWGCTVHCTQRALAGIVQKCPLSTIFLPCGRDGDERWIWGWLETEPSSPKVFRKRQLGDFYFYNLFAAFFFFLLYANCFYYALLLLIG